MKKPKTLFGGFKNVEEDTDKNPVDEVVTKSSKKTKLQAGQTSRLNKGLYTSSLLEALDALADYSLTDCMDIKEENTYCNRGINSLANDYYYQLLEVRKRSDLPMTDEEGLLADPRVD